MSEPMVTVLTNGRDEIVDVLFTEWEEVTPGEWMLVTEIKKHPVVGFANRLIVELPIGCYEQDIPAVWEGNTLTLYGSAGGVLRRCQRAEVDEVVIMEDSDV